MEFHNIVFFDLTAYLPEILLCYGIFCLLVYGVLSNASQDYGFPIAIKAIALLCIYLLFCSAFLIFNNGFAAQTYLQNLSVNNNLIQCIRIITILASAALVAGFLDSFTKDRINMPEAVILLLLAVLSACIFIGSNDLITVYLSIEMQSLCFYVLATLKRNSNFSTEAGLKYFVLGAFSSGLLLFGCSLIYGFIGTTNFEEINRLLFYSRLEFFSNGLALGMFFVFAAFMFKIAAAPFHVWITDVYEGAPTYVTAYFAVIPKLAIFGVICRFATFVFNEFSTNWQILTLACALASLSIGCMGALYQKKIKRLLAYSAISHGGFILLGLSSNSAIGNESIFFYMFIYIWMGLGMFVLLLNVRHNITGGRIIFLSEFVGISKTNPALAIILALILFSMAGVPPLAGFFSKMYIFFAALGSYLYTATFFALILSALCAVYYIRIIKIAYFDNGLTVRWFASPSKYPAIMLSVITSGTIFLCISPYVVSNFAIFSCMSFVF
jgi:NADH-quinone oxidoreductase subunit N